MGLMDTIKDLVSGHKDEVKQGLDKAGGVIGEKTGNPQIQSAVEKGKDAVDKLGDGA